jgi:hypothetical protein
MQTTGLSNELQRVVAVQLFSGHPLQYGVLIRLFFVSPLFIYSYFPCILGESVYGDVFEDENFIVQHNKRGVLSMSNNGLHSNGSQFCISFRALPWMDKKYVAFG